MYWIIIEEGLALARTALTAARVINTTNAIGNALTPEMEMDLAVNNEVEEEEIFFYVAAASIHEELTRTTPVLSPDRERFIEWTSEALDSPMFESSSPIAGARTSSFITCLGKAIASDAPNYRIYFNKSLETYEQSKDIPLDIIRKFLSNKENSEWLKAKLTDPETLTYLEKDVDSVFDKLKVSKQYDAKSRYPNLMYGNTVISYLSSLFPGLTLTTSVAFENIRLNTSFAPSFNSKDMRQRSFEQKRYQDFSITSQMVKNVESALGDQMDKYALIATDAKGFLKSEDDKDSDLLKQSIALAATAQLNRFATRKLNRIKTKGAAYARKKWGRNAGQMAQKILSAYALKKGIKR